MLLTHWRQYVYIPRHSFQGICFYILYSCYYRTHNRLVLQSLDMRKQKCKIRHPHTLRQVDSRYGQAMCNPCDLARRRAAYHKKKRAELKRNYKWSLLK